MNLEEIKNTIKNTEKYNDDWKTMTRTTVNILLTEIKGTPNIIFEVRGKNLREQPGDICFPGGKIDKDETPKEAVIREIEEELGLSFKNVEIIKELDTLIRYSGLIIHPFFGIVKDLSEIKLSKDEVEELFYVPIDYLINYNPLKVHSKIKVERADDFPFHLIKQGRNYKFKDGEYISLFYEYKNYIIWGITAQMLNSFLENIKKVIRK